MKVTETIIVELDRVEVSAAVREYLLDKGYVTKEVKFNIEEFTDNSPAAKLAGVSVTVTKVKETNP